MTTNNLERLLLLLWLGFWVAFPQTRALEAQTTSNPVNLIVQIDGEVKVKRQGWTNYAPVVFGTVMYSGDLVSVGESSRAKVVCSDLTLHDVPTGIGGVPCSASRVVLTGTDDSLIDPTRGPNDGSPVVLSPRKTKLLSANPTLRWAPVKGATTYKVEVRGEGGKHRLDWSTIVSYPTELVYPETAPRLEADVNYKLIVTASDRSSSNEPFVGFSVLSSKNKKAVLEKQKHIENLKLAAGPTQFLIARLYADHDLYAEAIERLEVISQTFKAAAVKRLLGDLHLKVGLTRQAEADYLAALHLSNAENDDEGQMLLHKSLAYIYRQILGNEEMTGRHLNATLDLANKLGDYVTATQVRKQLAELKTPGA
jgi:hypothetical protein